MGGHHNGEIASRLAVNSVRDAFDRRHKRRRRAGDADLAAQRLEGAIGLANRRVRDEVGRNPSLEGMGTTIVAILLDGDEATIAHVGDSRAYVLRGQRLELLTSDHTWVNEQLSAGNLSEAQALVHPFKNVVTRALGGEEEVDTEINRVALESGDLYLLCSDGLTTMLSEQEIVRLLRSRSSLDGGCRELVRAANAVGGRDNITVLLVEVG